MRWLLGLSCFFLSVGCSNACPPPVLCSQPHPDNCPCNIEGVDAYRAPVDAFVQPAEDADIDADLPDTGPADDAASATDAGADDAGDDTGIDAHHP